MRPSSRTFLPYGRQCIEADDVAAVTRVLESEWLTTGPETGSFEQTLAAKVGAGHAVACSSGTAALHLAAMALGLGPGDRVVVPAITFLATANAVRYTGAEVAFADVSPETGLMEPSDLAEAIERAPRDTLAAVFPVHLNGQCCDLPAIRRLTGDAGLKVVEDAAHAIGARHPVAEGREALVGACACSEMTVFSLHPVKTVTMGEGGVVTTADAERGNRLRRLRNHGMIREAAEFRCSEQALDQRGRPNPWYYEMHRPGFNYRASDLHCALGRSQLGKLERFVARRAELVAQYDRLLADLLPIVRPVARVPGTPAWHLYVVLIDFDRLDIERADLVRALRVRGVGTQVHYLPLYRQPYYRDCYGEQRLPGAERYYARCLSLPLFPTMNEADVERVVAALYEVVERG